MLPFGTAGLLKAVGHQAATPARLGAHNLPDDVLIQLAASDGRVIVTENASDFASVTTCPVLFVLKGRVAHCLPRDQARRRHRWMGHLEPGPRPLAPLARCRTQAISRAPGQVEPACDQDHRRTGHQAEQVPLVEPGLACS